MKTFFCTILSVIVFAVSFQNTLILVDYSIHKEFYERHCMNQNTPAIECHGKCQAKKQSEKNGTPVSVVKTGSFEFHFLPALQQFATYSHDQPEVAHQLFYSGQQSVLKGFSEATPRPPKA